MKKEGNAILIIHTKVKPEKTSEFENWLNKLNNVLQTFPGFISQTFSSPNPPNQTDWIIVQNFDSIDAIKNWLQSDQRSKLIKEEINLISGIDNIFITQEKNIEQEPVTAQISCMVDQQNEDKFLQWQSKIAPLQSQSPGFIGYKLIRPKPGKHNWITILKFDSDENLEKWLNSKARTQMLDELKDISYQTNLQKIYSGFDFWFKKEEKNRSTFWKENSLVLLTLYPVVFLLSFIQNPLMKKGLPFWLALFFSNAASTIILACFTTPFLMKHFSWWLHPERSNIKKSNLMGTIIVISLYIVFLAGAWMLSGLL